MRILFTFIGGIGHLNPLVPIARAATAAGHDVAVAGAGGRQDEIRAAGITAFPTSERSAPRAVVEELLTPSDPAREVRHLAEGFARPGARRHAEKISVISQQWRPDVIVRDEVDFGSSIAAESLAIPCATVLVLPTGGFLRNEIVAEPLNELRAEYGLESDPSMAMLERGLVIAPFPPSLRSPNFPLPKTAFFCRPGSRSVQLRSTEVPTVYFTLGTVFGVKELFDRVLTGLATLPVRVVATVGERLSPESFGPRPSHVRIEQFISQSELLPTCDIVISHAGSGTVIGSLGHGLPSVLLPMGADQPFNAKRCLELGVAETLDPMSVTPEQIAAAVTKVLTEDSYRLAAERVRVEMNELPGPEATVPLLEELAGRR